MFKPACLLLALSATFFTSCRKEVNQPTTEKESKVKLMSDHINLQFIAPNDITVSVENGVLIFTSIDEYEIALVGEQQDLLLDFVAQVKSSAFYTFTEAFEANKENDPSTADEYAVIGNLVNSDGLIKIGNYTLCLDFANKLVYSIEGDDHSALLAAKNGTATTGVTVTGMNNDVLEQLQNNGELQLMGGIFCRDRYANTIAASSDRLYTNAPEYGVNRMYDYFLQASASYGAYGIYFELKSKGSAWPTSSAGLSPQSLPQQMKIISAYTCKRRCGNSFSGSNIIKSGTALIMTDLMNYGTRALTSYRLTTTVETAKPRTAGVTQKTVTIN